MLLPIEPGISLLQVIFFLCLVIRPEVKVKVKVKDSISLCLGYFLIIGKYKKYEL